MELVSCLGKLKFNEGIETLLYCFQNFPQLAKNCKECSKINCEKYQLCPIFHLYFDTDHMKSYIALILII